jgi:hypothetical protein
VHGGTSTISRSILGPGLGRVVDPSELRADGLRGSGLSAPTVEGAPPCVIVAGLCKRPARGDKAINPEAVTGANPCRALLCRSQCRLRESPWLSPEPLSQTHRPQSPVRFDRAVTGTAFPSS